MTRFRRARSPQDGKADTSTTTGLPLSIRTLFSMLLLLVMPANGWGTGRLCLPMRRWRIYTKSRSSSANSPSYTTEGKTPSKETPLVNTMMNTPLGMPVLMERGPDW